MGNAYKSKLGREEVEGMAITADNVAEVVKWIETSGHKCLAASGHQKPTESLVKGRIGQYAMFHTRSNLPNPHCLFFVTREQLERDYENDE